MFVILQQQSIEGALPYRTKGRSILLSDIFWRADSDNNCRKELVSSVFNRMKLLLGISSKSMRLFP